MVLSRAYAVFERKKPFFRFSALTYTVLSCIINYIKTYVKTVFLWKT